MRNTCDFRKDSTSIYMNWMEKPEEKPTHEYLLCAAEAVYNTHVSKFPKGNILFICAHKTDLTS